MALGCQTQPLSDLKCPMCAIEPRAVPTMEGRRNVGTVSGRAAEEGEGTSAQAPTPPLRRPRPLTPVAPAIDFGRVPLHRARSLVPRRVDLLRNTKHAPGNIDKYSR